MGVKVSVKDGGPCEKVLSVAVTGDMIRDEYNEFFQHLGREAKVPGFRPGKAPREVLESHFKNEARERVLERLISRSFRDAIGEKQIEFFGRPTIRGVEFTDDKLAYEALIEVPPPIKLKKYKGLAATRKAVEVKPEEVNESLERVRETLAKFVAVEDRPAALGDFLIADYRCSIEGKEVENRTDDWFELREEEFLKGFSTQLVGSRPTEEKEVRIHFPENFGRKEWAGKEGIFQVKVKEIKTKKLPELNDDLAKETGEFQSLEELRGRLEGQIKEGKARESETEYESALLEALVKENPVEAPKGVVERRLSALLDATVQSLYRRKLRPEMIQKELPALRDKLQPEAEREVRVSFLLEEIAKRESLKAEPDDFDAKYKEAAARHRQSEEVVKKYYEEHTEAKEALGIQILHEKAIQLIKDNAK